MHATMVAPNRITLPPISSFGLFAGTSDSVGQPTQHPPISFPSSWEALLQHLMTDVHGNLFFSKPAPAGPFGRPLICLLPQQYPPRPETVSTPGSSFRAIGRTEISAVPIPRSYQILLQESYRRNTTLPKIREFTPLVDSMVIPAVAAPVHGLANPDDAYSYHQIALPDPSISPSMTSEVPTDGVCVHKCHSCGVTETPEWRRGPNGLRTLCNACGLVHAKLVKKLGSSAAAEEFRRRRYFKSYRGRRISVRSKPYSPKNVSQLP